MHDVYIALCMMQTALCMMQTALCMTALCIMQYYFMHDAKCSMYNAEIALCIMYKLLYA